MPGKLKTITVFITDAEEGVGWDNSNGFQLLTFVSRSSIPNVAGGPTSTPELYLLSGGTTSTQNL